ncbi:MAG: PAS domain-containing protein [Verrucomicrobiota bacterium]
MKTTPETMDFEKIASHLTDAVVVTDKKGNIRWCNNAFTQLCGYTKKEVKGKKPSVLLQGESTNPKTVAKIRAALDEGRCIRTEILNYHKKGHSYWVSISIAPLKNSSGKIEGFVSIERDISYMRMEMADMEEQIVQLYSVVVNIQQVYKERDPENALQRDRIRN